MLPNPFYEDTVSLIPKSEKDSTKKRDAKIKYWQNTFKLHSDKKKDDPPQLIRLHPRDEG